MSDDMIVPDKLDMFMYALMKLACRESFVDFCANWGIEFETDFAEIEKWFLQFGVEL